MTGDELRFRVAELVGNQLYVIVKRGAYYRPNAAGYTGSLAEAWKLPQEEAKRYEMYADRDDVPGCEKVLIEPAPSPDYPNDLNACQDFERPMLDAQDRSRWFRYLTNLRNECFCGGNATHEDHVAATAEQRCRAFIATMEPPTTERSAE